MAVNKITPEQIAKVKEGLAQKLGLKQVMARARVSKNVVYNIMENPGHYDVGELAKPHGEEERYPVLVHFNEDDTQIPIEQRPTYERCRQYRGRPGCNGMKQVAAECLVCRDRYLLEEAQLQQQNLDWEEFMDQLLGPAPSPLLTDSTIIHTPIPGKEIIVDEALNTLHSNPDLGNTKPTPPEEKSTKEIDKIINSVKKNLHLKRRRKKGSQ